MEEKNDNDDAWLGNLFDDVQPLPLVQHPDQQPILAEDVDIAKAIRNTCVVGACFHHETNAGPMFIGTFIREAALINGSLGQRKSGHQVSDSSVNKNGFCLQCISKKRREAKKKGGVHFWCEGGLPSCGRPPRPRCQVMQPAARTGLPVVTRENGSHERNACQMGSSGGQLFITIFTFSQHGPTQRRSCQAGDTDSS